METPRYERSPDIQPTPPSQENLAAWERRAEFTPYLLDEELVKAVNLAIYLRRPLLLQGDPGCGKTQLAQSIAYQFGHKTGREWLYRRWNIKTTSRAKEGLYTYDTVGRLRDVQIIGAGLPEGLLKPKERQDLFDRIKNPDQYVKYGPLGEAFDVKDHRPIVLIDEIDKADRDFPNDLLEPLEDMTFKVDEIQESIHAKQTPIVIITSNSERDLPDAFLRRCVYFFLQFPDEEALRKIINAHFTGNAENEWRAKLVKAAVEEFLMLRETGVAKRSNKRASTSELLDWVRWLSQFSDEDAIALVKTLADNSSLLGVLLKSPEAQENYQASVYTDESSNEVEDE